LLSGAMCVREQLVIHWSLCWYLNVTATTEIYTIRFVGSVGWV